MPELAIATAPRANSRHWTNGSTSWDAFVKKADDPADHKECGGYLLGVLDGTSRNKEAILSRSAVTLDADYARADFPKQVAELGYAALVHTTFRSTPEKPRYRVVFPLSRPVTPDEYRCIVAFLMARLGREQFDRSSAEPERFMFRPSAQDPANYWHQEHEGPWLDVDQALADADMLGVSPELVAATVEAEGTPYADLTTNLQLMADERVEHTVSLWRATLAKVLDWPVGKHDERDRGWEAFARDAAWALAQLGCAAWSPMSWDDAEATYRQILPSEIAAVVEDKWPKADKVASRSDLLAPWQEAASDFDVLPPDESLRLRTNPGGGWERVDLLAYADGTHQPPRTTLLKRTDGMALLYPAMTHSLHGESESGKSMIAQSGVAELLREGSPCLYIDYEADPGSVVERLRLMGVGREHLALLTYVQPEVDYGHTVESRAAFENLLSQRFELVVLDGVTEALAQAPAKARSTGGLGGNDDITVWHDRLPRLLATRTGAAVVLIDHVPKNPEAGRFAIGGQAKMATISGAAYLVRPTSPLGRGLVGEVDIFVAKDRHGCVRSYAAGEYGKDRLQLVATAMVDGRDGRLNVRLVPPTPTMTRDGRKRAVMAAVCEFLATLPDDHPGASGRMVRSEVRGNSTDIGAALDALVQEGFVTRVLKGQGSLHQLARPFSDVEET